MTKLFVSGFPLESDEMALARLISPYGNISTIKIVRDRQTRKCKGYAFVEMQTLADATNVAVALDGEWMADRELTVKISEDRPVAVTGRAGKRPVSRDASRRSSPQQELTGENDRLKRPRRMVR